MGIRYWVLGWVDDWMNDGRYRMQNGMNVEHRMFNARKNDLRISNEKKGSRSKRIILKKSCLKTQYPIAVKTGSSTLHYSISFPPVGGINKAK